MLETSYILNLGQSLKLTIKLKKYFQQKMKFDKPQIVANTVTKKKKKPSVIIEVATSRVVISNHMAVLQIQIRKNIIEDVLLNGRFGVIIIIEP